MKISEVYDLPGQLPFVDVDVDNDNKLFMDLAAIRHGSGHEPYRTFALDLASSFLDVVTSDILTTGPLGVRAARDKMRFPEPRETRLGLSETGFDGHGGSRFVGALIVQALSENVRALVKVGILKNLDQLPIFVDGVGADFCSDLTTRVIYSALIDFTHDMMRLFPHLAVGAKRVRIRRWDHNLWRWVDSPVELPAPHGRPIVLVPRGWAQGSPLVSARRFHRIGAVGAVQNREATYDQTTGQLLKTPKDEIARRSSHRDIKLANLRETLLEFEDGTDLLEAFDAYVRNWFIQNGKGVA